MDDDNARTARHVRAQPHVDSSFERLPHGENPVPEEEVAERAVGDAAASCGQQRQLLGAEVDAVGQHRGRGQEATPVKDREVAAVALVVRGQGGVEVRVVGAFRNVALDVNAGVLGGQGAWVGG